MPYDPDWPCQFHAEQERLSSVLRHLAVDIAHIGSTAVPGLAAKDVIDIQVSVVDLSGEFDAVLSDAGYCVRDGYQYDEFAGFDECSVELRKRYARERPGDRRTHIHIRQIGRFNYRYALLFRDFLRANSDVAEQYAQFKMQAASAYPEDIDGYLALKAPVFNMLYQLAESWGRKVSWKV